MKIHIEMQLMFLRQKMFQPTDDLNPQPLDLCRMF